MLACCADARLPELLLGAMFATERRAGGTGRQQRRRAAAALQDVDQQCDCGSERRYHDREAHCCRQDDSAAPSPATDTNPRDE